VQVFTKDGAFLEQWNVHRPVAVVTSTAAVPAAKGGTEAVLVGELGTGSYLQRGDGFNALNTWTEGIGHCVGVYVVAASSLEAVLA
jgi:hypothetical protein